MSSSSYFDRNYAKDAGLRDLSNNSRLISRSPVGGSESVENRASSRGKYSQKGKEIRF